jgi:hypothetical protein
MVQPRPRGKSSCDLNLPHSYGSDPDCKSSPKKLEKRLRVAYYRYSKKIEKEIIFLLGFIAIGLFLRSSLKSPWSSRGYDYPWESMSRPAKSAKPKTPSKIYGIPNSMSMLGDKSDFYAELRKAYDTRFPPNEKRSLEVVERLQKFDVETFHSMHLVDEDRYYDIYNCPDEPPIGYPFAWKLLKILNHWPADEPEPRTQIFQSLCVFDYVKDYKKAKRYRDAEVPFVVKGDPEVAKTVERWNTPHYVDALLGHVEHDTEYSVTNHFLFWRRKKDAEANPRDWKQPTQRMHMTYKEWLAQANVTDTKLGPDMPHWYFRISGCREGKGCGPTSATSAAYVFDELPFYQPKHASLYVKEPNWQKGIFCMFGMKGVIAESHFDGSHNFLTVLEGERRYILAHPNQCGKLALYPPDHPSARHSAVDWSDPDLEAFPQFGNATGNEVVLQAGHSLFLPSLWFHHIISSSLNIQCNTVVSGFDSKYSKDIEQCGHDAP